MAKKHGGDLAGWHGGGWKSSELSLKEGRMAGGREGGVVLLQRVVSVMQKTQFKRVQRDFSFSARIPCLMSVWTLSHDSRCSVLSSQRQRPTIMCSQ